MQFRNMPFGGLGCLTVLCIPVLLLLGIYVYVVTVFLSFQIGWKAGLGALFSPGVAQLVWIWVLRRDTGTFFNPLTIACAVFLVLAVFCSVVWLAQETSVRKS